MGSACTCCRQKLTKVTLEDIQWLLFVKNIFGKDITATHFIYYKNNFSIWIIRTQQTWYNHRDDKCPLTLVLCLKCFFLILESPTKNRHLSLPEAYLEAWCRGYSYIEIRFLYQTAVLNVSWLKSRDQIESRSQMNTLQFKWEEWYHMVQVRLFTVKI